MQTAQAIDADAQTRYFFTRACRSFADKSEQAFYKYHNLLQERLRSRAAEAEAPDDALAALLYQSGERDAVLALFERFKSPGMGDLLPTLAAGIHFARKAPHKALAAAKYINDIEARRLRQKTAEIWPDLTAPLEKEPRVHLLILAHNREAYITGALLQLAQTHYRNYAVYIADNGSTDATLARAREAAAFFPSYVRVHIESFPVNIGRPAGHNWLLQAHDHSAAEFIAIGDDDLTRVPPSWLASMVKTARTFPGCGCVGGKALTPGWSPTIHGSAYAIEQFGPTTIVIPHVGEHVDLAQFDYVDMVDHVIGCLNLFSRKALEDVGLFDIRLSPCQFVDVEHHLRMCMAGYPIIFNGLIAFEHMRAMGVKAAHDRALAGNSLGNIVKLLHKYDHEAVRETLALRHADRNRRLLGRLGPGAA
jgi:GT2 family glycosyltransferase